VVALDKTETDIKTKTDTKTNANTKPSPKPDKIEWSGKNGK